MVARFSSVCPRCQGAIVEGSEITKKAGRWVCADCAAPAGKAFSNDTSVVRPAEAAFGHEPGCWGDCDGGCGEGPTTDSPWAREPSVIEIRTSGGTFSRNAAGRCEDAPCCGCCTI